MGGSSTNFGSRSEFLPGDGLQDPDIKYERYGGCFISTKRGLLFVIISLLFTALVAYLVYRYAPRYKDDEFKTAEDLISNLMETASKLDNKNAKLKPILPTNVIPNYYRLRIQPYLDEIGPKNFSFEGHVAIVFQVNDTSTNSIVINVKNLTISDSDILVSYSTTSKIEPLKSESQIKEETTIDTINNDTEIITTPASDPASNIADVTVDSNAISENNTETNVDNDAEGDVTVSPISPVSPTEPLVYQTAHKTNIKVLRQRQDDYNETLTIYLDDSLEKNINYTLEIGFSGKILDGPAGFLRSKYIKTNETRWIGSTLFKPYYARMVFPCFDEPNFKAKFEISVGRRTNMTSLSNMPVKDTLPIENSPGWVWDHFAMTPVIPTFAVAFAVFNFNPKKALSTAPLPVINVWAQSEVLNKSSYLLDVTPKILTAYNNFYGYNYPAAKIDLVAVPDYPVPALGNWGLIFLKEIMLSTETNEAKEELNEILSQELSSQWLGTIVTMKSWNAFWFTEVLNSYARYIGIAAAEPTWNMLDEISFRDQQEILDADSIDILPNITTLVSGYNYLENNRLLYKKGSTVIRILNHTLTEPVFLEIMRNFVTKWQYNNTREAKFWEEVAISSNNTLPEGITPKEMINLWFTQKGFPLLNLTTTSNGSITVKQNRYTEDNIPNNNLWIILIQVITNSTITGENKWLQNSSTKINEEETETKNNSWILITTPQMGLCRINYDLKNWAALITVLHNTPEILSPPNRAHLIDDAFHLARTGVIPYNIPLNLSLYLVNESSLIPWQAAFNNFEYLDLILAKTTSYGDFQEYVKNLLVPIYNKLSPTDSTDRSTLKLRKLIFSWACKLSYPPCIDWAYSEYLSITNSTHQNNQNEEEFRAIVYCVGAEMRGKIAWDYFWNKYFNTSNKPSDTKAIFTGIGCLKELWILPNYLENVLKDECTENSILAWETLSSTYSIDVALDFIINKWALIQQKYSYSRYAVKRILNAVLSKLVLKSDLDKLLKFFSNEKSKLEYFARDFAFIIEKIKMRIDWQEKHLMTFKNSIKISML